MDAGRKEQNMGTYNIHAGHCPHGQGASGAVGYLKESVEDRAVKNLLIANLKSQGNTVYDCTDDTNCTARQNLQRIVAKCNAHSVEKDVSIHLNAGGGTGVEVWIVNPAMESAAAKICAEVAASLGIKNRGVKYSNNLYVLNHTKAPALLIECCFVDSQTDYNQWNVRKCADAITGALTGRKTAGSTAAWVKDSIGWWYRHTDGSYPKAQWVKLDTWYYFNAKGYALADEWLYYKDKWYYLKKDCRMAVGWQQIDGYWYYLGSDGVMLDGWQQIKGKWYYLDQEGEERPHGAMVTGEMKDGNHTYYLQDNGAMAKGWIKRKGSWYYYNEDNNCQPIGSMMRNHWQGGYYLKDDGRMASGEVLEIGGEKCEFDADGKVKK